MRHTALAIAAVVALGTFGAGNALAATGEEATSERPAAPAKVSPYAKANQARAKGTAGSPHAAPLQGGALHKKSKRPAARS